MFAWQFETIDLNMSSNSNAMIGKQMLIMEARDPVEPVMELITITHAVPQRMREAMAVETGRLWYGVVLTDDGHLDDFAGLVTKSGDKRQMEQDAKEAMQFFDQVQDSSHNDKFVKLSWEPPVMVDVMITIHSSS